MTDSSMLAAANARFHTGNINARANAYRLGNPNVFVKKFLHLCQLACALAEGDDSVTAEEVEALARDLSNNEIETVKLSVERLGLESVISRQDVDALQTHIHEIDGKIKVAEADILQRQGDLDESRMFVNRQQEYEQLKSLLMAHPKRSQTASGIAACKAKMDELQQESARLDAELEVRRKQFSQLGMILRDLSTAVLEDFKPAVASAKGSEDGPASMELG